MLDIIMACHNHLKYTIDAIDALKRNTVGEYRLTIVDDSTDLTPEYIKSLDPFNLKYIRPEVKIVEGNQNVNIGLMHTESNPVVFMAQQTLVEPNWNQYPLEIMRMDNKIALVGAKLLYENGLIEHVGICLPEGAAYWCDIGRGAPGHQFSDICEVPAVGFALVFINRLAFPNGFPEKLYPHGFAGPDDVDICFSIRKQGWKIMYCGMCCAYHKANAVRDKGTDYNLKVEECRKFFISRWGVNGSQLKEGV